MINVRSFMSILLLACSCTLAWPKDDSGTPPNGQGAENGAATSSVDLTNEFPDHVMPDGTITITGKFDAKEKSVKVSVKIFEQGTNKSVWQFSQAPDDDKKKVVIKLPGKDTLLPGTRYYVTLSYDNIKDLVLPGELRIASPVVTLDSAHPTTAYRNDNGGFNFDVIGQGFSPDIKNDQVVIKGQGAIRHSVATSEEDCKAIIVGDKEKKPCIWYDKNEPDKLHVVGYREEPYQGPLSFHVQVGEGRSEGEKPLVLARISPVAIRFWSLIIFGVIGYIIYRLASQGVKDSIIGGQTYSPFQAFFLDKETNSYSLSKFQLLLFSAVFVFGYLYVLLCGWLVQWHFALPDVPSAFSGILGISAGTVVVAAGATSSRGSKGAGDIRPSAADFITTGGQVVPERFQFFVWTLVACFGFVALLLSQDPATIVSFPDFPQGLLYIMGVSATGYLGGKLTRPPGPVIRNITWDKSTDRVIVQGENLSNAGDYFVDGKKLPINTSVGSPPYDGQQLIQSTPQEQASDRTFCSELKITIAPGAGLDLSTGDHTFRVMNKDAQYADARFTADLPEIAYVEMTAPSSPPLAPPPGGDANRLVRASKQNTEIRVTGSGFRPGMKASWTPVGASESIVINSVQFDDSQHVRLTVVPGDIGTAGLKLTTPSDFSVVATITVV